MKKILLIFTILPILIFSGCIDLDLNPLSEGSSGNWYSSQQEIEMSLNDFYRTDFFPIDSWTWSDDMVWRNTTTNVQNGTMTSEDGTTFIKVLPVHCVY